MEGKDVVESYSDKLKEQIDQMDEDKLIALTDQVVEYGNSIEELTAEQIQNITVFFEHGKIPPVSRIVGVRELSYGSMRGHFISAPLAIRLAKDIEDVPKGFWESIGAEKDNKWEEDKRDCRGEANKRGKLSRRQQNSLIGKIDVTNDFEKLKRFVGDPNLSWRVRRAAALKAVRLTKNDDDADAKAARVAELLGTEEENK